MHPDLVRVAHADVWEAHGRHREAYGGGVARLPGIRLMAAGLPHAQWNSGDVTDPSLVGIEAVRQWYADKGVPWGLRVALGADWGFGRHLLSRRLLAVEPGGVVVPDRLADVSLRQATVDDVEAVVAVDAVAFDEPVESDRPWVSPLLTQPRTTMCLAELDGEPVGSGHVVITDGDAGRAAYLGGIGVLPHARSRGIGTAITCWLIDVGMSGGVNFLHLSPDTDDAARIYERLGFVDVPGFDVYVDC